MPPAGCTRNSSVRYYETGSLREANWFQRVACMSVGPILTSLKAKKLPHAGPVREEGLVGLVRLSRPSNRKTA